MDGSSKKNNSQGQSYKYDAVNKATPIEFFNYKSSPDPYTLG